jgi:hypothetical protein
MNNWASSVQGLVIGRTRGVEVGRQVLVGVAEAVGANDPDLLARQALVQGLQYADLIVDALHADAPLAVHMHDRLQPVRRHDAVERHLLVAGEVPLGAGDIAPQQVDGQDHRAVGGVVRTEFQDIEQLRQEPARVRAVGGVQPRLYLQGVAGPMGLVFGHQFA